MNCFYMGELVCPLLFYGNFIIPVQQTAFAQTFFGKSLTKNFFERIERQGLRPRTPWSFAVCGRRPKALPLETASF